MTKNSLFSGGSFSPDTATIISKKKGLSRIFTMGGIIGTLLLSSCSDNSDIVDLNQEEINNQDQILTLVPAQEELIEIHGSLGPENSFKTTQAAGTDNGRFNISLKFILPVSEAQEEVFKAAAARWERLIIEDVPSITGTIPSAFVGFPPVSTGTIDDIVIEVAIAPIDGPGKVLGQAGPRYVRNSDLLPLAGVMFFDVADLDFLDRLDLFEEVIVHEMGHVLGIGTLWNYNRNLNQGPLSNPYFTGKMANTFWNAEGGTDMLPIENQGGPGTAGGHWRESVLQNELMTGYINLGVNPLSRITAGSVADLGYGAAVVGEQYALPRGTSGVELSELAESGEGIHIAEGEVLLKPIGVVISK